MPRVDLGGYTEFLLHDFMKTCGKYMILGGKEVINPIEIIVDICLNLLKR